MDRLITEIKVFIIILNWNGFKDTIECLESIRKIDYPNYETIVVDNGSTDGSQGILKKIFPEITLIENKANLGYAGGNNVGIRHALKNGADYIFILNNDTVVDPAIFNEFINAAGEHNDAGIFGAKVYYYSEPNKIWSVREDWDKERLSFFSLDRGALDGKDNFSGVIDVALVLGCALFVRADVFKRIGLFEEKFFLCFEEVDFCFRAKKMGYKNVVVSNAKIWHKVSVSFNGASSPMKEYFDARNELLWAKRNLPFSLKRNVYKRRISAVFIPNIYNQNDLLIKRIYWDFIRLLSEFNNPLFIAKAMGIIDFCLGKFGDCPNYIHKLNSRSVKIK